MIRNGKDKKAFTLIELLTVVAIIAMLIAMFGVGMRKVKIIQKNLQQKAAFHGMEVGLELFSKDSGEYPDSNLLSGAGGTVTGAQRLAETLLGRDEQGFHPRSKWHPGVDAAQMPPHPGPATYTSVTEKDRMPEYIELKRSGVYTIHQLWGGAGGAGFASSPIYTSAAATTGTQRSPVITDVFNKNRSDVVDEKVGMPVLYFKADPPRDFRVISLGDGNRNNKKIPANLSTLSSQDYQRWVYNYGDNVPVLELPWLREPDQDTDTSPSPHYQDTDINNDAGVFYKLITQREEDTDGNGESDFFKPYNPNTFILISAGYDGIYGTKDDLTNFEY